MPLKPSFVTGSLIAVALAALPSQARAEVTRAQCVESYERAQYLRKEAKLREAREVLLVCAQDACPAATKSDCVPWLAEVERAIPSVSVAVRDATGKDVTSAKITLDGAPLAGASEGAAVSVDPGTHVLRAEEGGRTAEEQIVVRAGEKVRVVTLTFRGPAAAGGGGGAVSGSTTEPPREEPKGRSYAVPIVLTAVGAVGIGGALFFGLGAQSDESDMRKTCAPRCPQSDIDAAESKLLYSDIALGVGVVALAAATYFWIAGGTSSSKAQLPGVTPVIGNSRGSLAIRF